MSQDNQIIDFVKWLLKWFLIVIFGLVLLALGTWGIVAAYQYLTNDRHLKNIEISILSGTDINIDEFLKNYPAVDKQRLINIYLQDGLEKYREARNLLLKDLSEFDSMMVRHALGMYIVQEKRKEGKDFQFPEPLTLCTNEAPVFIGYINKTPNIIEFISIDLTATLPKRSTNILNWTEFESDYVTAPGESYGECIAVPLKEEYKDYYDLKNAVYESQITTVRFKKD